MGGGSWDSKTYHDSATSRAVAGTDTFAYSASMDFVSPEAVKAHPDLDSMRIKDKPLGMLESRDSAEHPNSHAIVVALDVTGSNKSRAIEAQGALDKLVTMLTKYISDPQVAIWANDDPYACSSKVAFQASDFESDNRVDNHLQHLLLVGRGGANAQEGYDMVFYCAARKVVMDSLEKRGKKGYLFLYADENIPDVCEARFVKKIFGDDIQDIKIKDLIEEAKEKFNIFIIWPEGGYNESLSKSISLFGKDHVLVLQHPDRMCELIGSTIGAVEGKLNKKDLHKVLTEVGLSNDDIDDITTALAPVYAKHNHPVKSETLKPSGSAGASKL